MVSRDGCCRGISTMRARTQVCASLSSVCSSGCSVRCSQVGQLVRIVGGEHAGEWRDAYLMVEFLGDDRYIVAITDHGRMTFEGAELEAAQDGVWGASERKLPPLPIPTDVAWGASQRTAVDLLFSQRKSASMTVSGHSQALIGSEGLHAWVLWVCCHVCACVLAVRSDASADVSQWDSNLAG